MGWGRFELPISSMSRRCHSLTRPPTRVIGKITGREFKVSKDGAIGLSQCTYLFITGQIRSLVYDMQDTIKRVTNGEDLQLAAAERAATAIFEDATDAQIGALLTALRIKGETETEIAGFARGMRAAARSIDPADYPIVDIVGTGGDDYNTINVSTTSAIVAAGAGVTIAKHGNYSVSSSSGSADVLKEIGVSIEAEPAQVKQSIEDRGIGFMLAPVFHPAMKAVIGPRKELGMRTVFNVLGPLTNPADADAQIIGVYDEALVPVIANAVAELDVERALVVHGAGLDELALHADSTVAEVTGSTIEEYSLDPTDVGVSRADVGAIAGGSPTENAADLKAIVEGERRGPKRDVILLNAGAAIYIGGDADSIAEGVERAANAIDEGHAASTLERMRRPLEA